MKNVYIGKETKKGLAICKVLDSDIATGNITVYNRESRKIEILLFTEKRTLPANIRKLAEDTEKDF